MRVGARWASVRVFHSIALHALYCTVNMPLPISGHQPVVRAGSTSWQASNLGGPLSTSHSHAALASEACLAYCWLACLAPALRMIFASHKRRKAAVKTAGNQPTFSTVLKLGWRTWPGCRSPSRGNSIGAPGTSAGARPSSPDASIEGLVF